MADIVPPRTPTPGSRNSRRNGDEGSLQSPNAIGAMTPPSSDRKSRPIAPAKNAPLPTTPSKHSRTSSATKTSSWGNSFSGASPSTEQIRDMPEDLLRVFVSELVPALGEARMELAHTRLQFQLLAMEAKEQADRAEVEHEMTRKELEVLQAGSPIIQNRAVITPDPRSALAQVQRQLEGAIQGGHQLEVENEALGQRLKDAKRVIKYLDGQVFDLKEINKMLRDRIRDNRDHLNAMRSSGLLRSAPGSPKAGTAVASASGVSHYATPARPRKGEPLHSSRRNSQLLMPNTARPQDDPFGALLFAGEVLDAQHQRSSVPSTPSPNRVMRRQQPGHNRGAMSLSSLPVTPKAAQFAPINVQTPVAQVSQVSQSYGRRGRRNSASTISDSQESRNDMLANKTTAMDDELLTDDDLPGSQASRAASDLLKRQTGDGLRQTKITGKVVKNTKRVHSGGKDLVSPKKQKTSGRDGLGLGIGVWPSPSR